MFIHPTAQIGVNVEVGEGTYIGPFCIIGFPAEHKTFWPYDEFTGRTGKVIIGKGCVITGHVTIDAGTISETIIGDGVWMMKHSHVGHDANIGNECVISCGAKIGGHAVIEKGTNIGLNAVVHQWKNIPEGCMIGMSAVVTKGLEMQPNCKYAGNPAKYLGPNVKK